MTSSFRSPRLAVPALAAAVAGVGLVGMPMHAAAAPTGSVTAFLKAPNVAALNRLAQRRDLTHAQRVAAVERLLPSAASERSVAATLRKDGLTTTSETSWSVTAAGPATTISSLFGTLPSAGAHASASALRVATGPLPRVPAALGASVSAVYPTTGGSAPFHPTATTTLDGSDFRNADTPAGVKPTTGTHDAGTTVATLQLADFFGGNDNTASDLTSYANEHHLTDPVADHQYKAVPVDGGPSASDDSTGGDLEVDLDQESILSTAPSADQHAYFAPNTQAGFNDVFANVLDDVVGNSHATAKDPHITALSSSWGECESETGAANIKALQPILASLDAAGVTIFSSSGDDGIYDCRSTTMTGADNSQADVDYPSSSPQVVSVGGTNLAAAANTPNTGSNWKEKVWSCTDPETCQSSVPPGLPIVPGGTGGGGGGASGSAFDASTSGSFKGFARPAYQRVAIKRRPFHAAKTRLLPDIAADADPDTGFLVFSSDPEFVAIGGGNDVQVGGTSLASPISAAQLDNALADAGHKTGVGDIHSALYSALLETGHLSAHSKKRPFRDVTVGSNGAAADKGTDPKVTANKGYDTVSGVGGVLWSALTPYLLNSHRPSVTASLSKVHRAGSRLRVRAHWHARRGKDSNLLAHTSVTIRRVGAAKPIARLTRASGPRTFTVKRGATYRIRVVTRDLTGRRSRVAVARRHVTAG